MTESSPRRRARRLPAIAAFGLALLAGAACTPQQNIYAVFGSRGAEADRVAWCESKHDPRAVSTTNDHGLFQINGVHEGQFEQVTGQPWDQVYNAYWNTVYAKHLHDTQGWSPWTCKP